MLTKLHSLSQPSCLRPGIYYTRTTQDRLHNIETHANQTRNEVNDVITHAHLHNFVSSYSFNLNLFAWVSETDQHRKSSSSSVLRFIGFFAFFSFLFCRNYLICLWRSSRVFWRAIEGNSFLLYVCLGAHSPLTLTWPNFVSGLRESRRHKICSRASHGTRLPRQELLH